VNPNPAGQICRKPTGVQNARDVIAQVNASGRGSDTLAAIGPAGVELANGMVRE